MTSERWDQVQLIFHGALALSGEQRDDYVAHECAGDDDLRTHVESLLAADVVPSPIFEHGVEELATVLSENRLADGESVGPYRLKRALGHGGMGTVYLAERADEQFEKRVALKLVKRGMDSDEILRRFRYERQILASLEHPNIARMYDGGRAADGRPYLVMEYIDGKPIDSYCDTNNLTVDERLGLFRTVCQAVQYAHQNLIVHRDLKPSNILVTEDGVVKLLDFGIAKLLDDESRDPETNKPAPMTRTGIRVMTPEYASPEQVRGDSITTASDVYQLGIVLYELLAGGRPFDLRGKTVVEAQRIVLEDAPRPPSLGLTDAAGGSRLGITKDRLRRRLAGDLDVITLKALRKEPDRRYASAEAFLADIKRHLEGLPVEARPDTLGYRLSKFVSRHRVAVAASVVVFAFVSVSAITLVVQQSKLIAERDRVQTEVEKVSEVRDFLIGLFNAANPEETLGDTTTVREILDRGVSRIDSLSDQPAVQAELLTTLGNVNRKLSNYDSARSLLERGIAVQRQLYPQGDESLARNLAGAAFVYFELSEFERARDLIRESLEMLQPIKGDTNSEVMSLMNNLALLSSETGQKDEAAALYADVLELRKRVLGPEDPKVAVTMNNLAMLLSEQGKLEAAEALHRNTLALRRKVLPATHHDIALSLNNLATLLRNDGRLDEAEPMYREALEIRQSIYGNDHVRTGISLYNVGTLLYAKGESESAEVYLRDALAVLEILLPPEHPRRAIAASALGECLTKLGKFDEAEKNLLHAYATFESRGDKVDLQLTAQRLAELYNADGQMDKAKRYESESLSDPRQSRSQSSEL